MSAADRTLYLERELGAPGAVASEVVRRLPARPPQDDVLAVAAPAASIDELMAPFQAGRPAPRLVTTAPLALLAAARHLAPGSLDEPVVVAHLGFSGLTVVLVVDGQLTLARQIPRPAAPGLDPLEWTGTEIQRTIRHHVMTVRGQAIARVLFATRGRAMEQLLCASGQLAERLRLPVENLNEALRVLLPPDVETETGVPAGGFLLAFGAALLDPGRSANLLPPALRDAQRSARVTRRALAAGLLLTLAVAGALGWAGGEVARRRAELVRTRQARLAREARVREAAGVEAARRRAAERLRLLLEDPLGAPPLADALREVSRAAPEGLRLARLAVARDGEGYVATLSGAVVDPDLAAAQRAFNRLYFGLRASPLFYGVTFAKRPPSAPEPAARPAAAGPAAPPPFAFDMTLRLKALR